MSDSTFHDEEFQNIVLSYLWREHSYFGKYEESFSPTYFDSSVNQAIFGCISSYYTQYRKTPSKEVLLELSRSQYPKDTEDDTRKRQAQHERISKLVECDITDDKFIDLKIREFVAYKAMYEFVSGALSGLKAGKYDADLPKKARLALAKGEKAFETGLHWTGDSYSRVLSFYEEDTSLKIPTNIALFDEHVRKGGMTAGELGLILALPKGFKCTNPYKENFMYDGTVKKSKDIKVGDLLMGDDSTPRQVLEVCSGRGQMYRVTQANGDPYEVTGNHVLCLKRLARSIPKSSRYHTSQFLEMTVEDYSKKPAGFHREWKGYKVGVDFPEQPVPLDPYFVGLWLGDGSSRGVAITVGDDDVELHPYLKDFAEKYEVDIRDEHKWVNSERVKCTLVALVKRVGKLNPVLTKLRSLGLVKPARKHIPNICKINDRKTRLQVLAGLIDSDGHYNKKKGFIFTNSNKQLCEDTCWLARSLGFKAHIIPIKSSYKKKDGTKKECPSYRVIIQGKISEIPTKLPRKKGKDSPKASERTALKVEPIGEGDWCGFLLDGNHHYLFSDFTVTHNSGTMLNFGYGAMKHFYQHSPAFRANGDTKTYDIGYLTLELSEELVASRFDRCCLGWDLNRILADPVGAAKALDQMRQFLGGDLYIKQYASKSASCDTFREYLDRMWEYKGVKFSELFVDYLDLVKLSGGQTRLREDTVSALICEELRELAIDYKIPIWSAVRANREAVSSPNISMKHMSKSFERIGIADITIALCQTEQEKQDQKMRIVPIASRNDAEGKQLNCTIDYARMRLYADEVVDIEYEDAKKGSGRAFDAFAQKGLMKKSVGGNSGEVTD